MLPEEVQDISSLLRLADSRKRIKSRYWSGDSLYSRTTSFKFSNGGGDRPDRLGLPQFGFPRRFAMNNCLSTQGINNSLKAFSI